MAQVECTIDIAAPPDDVFAKMADIPHADEFISGIKQVEMLSDGPVGVGTRWRETRTMLGREATEEMTISRFEPPHRYDVEAESHGAKYHSEIHVAPHGAGSQVRMVFQATPVSFFAKLMGFMMSGMMKSVEKHLRQDLEDIKAAVETGGSQAAESTGPDAEAPPPPASA